MRAGSKHICVVAEPSMPAEANKRLLGVEGVVQSSAVDERVPVGIGGDADAGQTGVVVEQIAEERQRVGVRAGRIGRVAGDDEHLA